MNWLKKLIVKLLDKWAKVSTPKPPEWPAGDAKKPEPQNTGCSCNMAIDKVPPILFGGEYECPVPNGMDIRFLCWHPGKGDWVFIPRPDGVTINGKSITATCSGEWHYVGYRVPRSDSNLVENPTGQYAETYRLYYERRVKT